MALVIHAKAWELHDRQATHAQSSSPQLDGMVRQLSSANVLSVSLWISPMLSFRGIQHLSHHGKLPHPAKLQGPCTTWYTAAFRSSPSSTARWDEHHWQTCTESS